MNKTETDVNYPPLSLLKTWAWMMTNDNSTEVQKKGQENLIQIFGSLDKANEYLSAQAY